MTDQLFPFTDTDLLREIDREIELRKRVYPRWVEDGRMTEKKAAMHLALMRAVKQRLAGLIDNEGASE